MGVHVTDTHTPGCVTGRNEGNIRISISVPKWKRKNSVKLGNIDWLKKKTTPRSVFVVKFGQTEANDNKSNILEETR